MTPREPASTPPSEALRVGFFVTCLTDTFYPQVGIAAVRVLRHFGCRVVFPPEQTCCGQPAYNSGLHREAQALLARMPRLFEDVDYVVTPSGSCASMICSHGEELISEGDARDYREFRDKTWEFVSFLTQVLRVDLPGILAEKTGRRVAFHYPCHLRGLVAPEEAKSTAVSFLGDRFAPLERFDQCCGFGGTFSIDSPEISDAMLEDKLACVAASGAEQLLCNEGGCALQISGGLHRAGARTEVVHLAEVLARALGLDQPGEARKK